MASKLLTKLKDLQKMGPGLHYSGICENIVCTDREYKQLRQLYKTWPYFSGNLHFPVPDPMKPKDPVAAEEIFDSVSSAQQLWADTQYGRLRYQLLNHCIIQLEIQLSKP